MSVDVDNYNFVLSYISYKVGRYLLEKFPFIVVACILSTIIF